MTIVEEDRWHIISKYIVKKIQSFSAHLKQKITIQIQVGSDFHNKQTHFNQHNGNKYKKLKIVLKV